jgi:tetratricopeptide (TPR) repeat protein
LRSRQTAPTLARQLRYQAADECYERALQLDPDSQQTRYNRAFARLALGRWLDAWPDYEHRFSLRELKGRKIEERPWDGSPLDGRTVLLYADQALGDTLQCLRYLPLVAAHGGRIVLAVQAPLLKLLGGLDGVENLCDIGKPLPHYDVQAALMSLPGLFGTTPDHVPADVPYLPADPALVEHWRHELGTLRAFKVGIAWQGNPHFLPGLRRSIPLAAFEPLARLPGVQLISLQKGEGTEQIAQVSFADKILDLSPRLDEASGPFMDTAAIMTQLDLTICCDTAVGHSAGALSVPVWLALPFVAEWRWLLDRDDTPWYPTMRLFRQREAGNWPEVFERIVAVLREEFRLPSEKV